MNFQYEATLDDIAEPHIRQFVRSTTYQRNRFYWVLWAAIGGGAFLLLIKQFADPEFPSWLILIFVLVSGIGCYFIYPDSVRKQIKKHLKRELKEEIPAITTYNITDTKVECRSLNIDISFDIKDLAQLSEDDERIELYFGPKGLCVIPKKAFATQEEINQFKDLFSTKSN